MPKGPGFIPHCAANHHGAADAEGLEDAGERFAKIRARHTHQHRGWPGRIQQRAEVVEDRGLAAFRAELARGNDMPKRRMIFGREEVSEVVPAKRTDGVLRPQIKRNPQCFHDIRAADGRGAGAVAVLGDQHPPRCRHKRNGRGDIKSAQAVAAGADNVEDFASAGFGIERW